MADLSNYPHGTWAGDPNAPWNQPCIREDDCEVCGQREGELEHPDLGHICYECWPKCWICGERAVPGSEGPCCEKHEREAMEDDANV